MKNLVTAFLIIGTLFIGTSSFASEPTHQARISGLKSEIIQVAKKATSKLKRQNEFSPETRKKLDPLVKELVSLSQAKSPAEQLLASVGSWQNLWSDLPYTSAIASQIYQVVFPTGYYYNVSKYEVKGAAYTSFLRGAYTLQKDNFEIVFTKAVKNLGFYKEGTDLYKLAMKAELKEFDGQIDEENQAGLNRPGVLTTLFVDQDLRIIGGELKENGVTDSLFILVPRTTVN